MGRTGWTEREVEPQFKIFVFWRKPIPMSREVGESIVRDPLIFFVILQTWGAYNLAAYLGNPEFSYVITLTSGIANFALYLTIRLTLLSQAKRAKPGKTYNVYISLNFALAAFVTVLSRLLLTYVVEPTAFQNPNNWVSDPFLWIVVFVILWALIEMGAVLIIKTGLARVERSRPENAQVIEPIHFPLRPMEQEEFAVPHMTIGLSEPASFLAEQAGSQSFSGVETSVTFSASQVVLGDITLDQEDILAAHAEGNYVNVITKTESHLVPGPLSKVLTSFEEIDGFQIHRSRWVALEAIEEVIRHNGEASLQLVNGETLKVARPRLRQFKDWIEKSGAPL